METSLASTEGNSTSPPDIYLPRRLFLLSRRTKHNRFPRWHHPKQYRIFLVPRNHISRTSSSSDIDHINLRVLVHSEILRIQDETHVHGHELFQCVHIFLWNAWAMDHESGIPSCARLLDLQYALWTLPSSILRICSDHDVRSHP